MGGEAGILGARSVFCWSAKLDLAREVVVETRTRTNRKMAGVFMLNGAAGGAGDGRARFREEQRLN